MKIIYTTAEYQFPNALYLLKHVLLVVSILSFALKSPARFVDYNYRTIIGPTERGLWPFASIHMQQLVNIPV